jgi:enoyl-CoA hydratase
MSELDVEITDRVATLTLNRPERRNALSSSLLRQLSDRMAEVDADGTVDVIVLTGADPAFCAGLDLRELGESGDNLGEPATDGWATPWAPTVKPVIADTHARVGVVPAWGMTVLLPAAVGMQRASYLSLTGDFLTADAAHDAGLVLEVVAHEQLAGRVRAIAAAMVESDQDVLRRILATQRAVALSTRTPGLRIEAAASAAHRAEVFDPSTVAARRQAVIDRGRARAR